MRLKKVNNFYKPKKGPQEDNLKRWGITVPDVEIKAKERQESGQKRKGKRIEEVGKGSMYYEHRRYIIGKLIEIDSSTGYATFVYDEDRISLNKAAGWSDGKRQYLFDNVKYKS